MRYLTRSIFVLFLGLAVSCGEETTDKKEEVKEAKEDENQTLKYTGSDTELALLEDLSNSFVEKNAITKEFDISGGGSGNGIAKFIAGEADVANASRLMTGDETAAAKENGVTPVKAIIALDAVAIISNPTIGVDSLSVDQVRSIFRGRTKNWSEVGGPDRPIKLYGRSESSGTYEYFKSQLVNGSYCPSVTELETNADLVESVKNDTNGIAYVSVAFIMDELGKPNGDVWATYIYIDNDKAYSPYEINAIESGDYVLARPLYQYFNGKPEGVKRDFLKYCLSDDGQVLIRKNGYFPLTPHQRSVNEKNGVLTP